MPQKYTDAPVHPASVIEYIAYYSDPDDSRFRKAAPSADTKVRYIVSTLQQLGYDVRITSKCEMQKRDRLLQYTPGYATQIAGAPVSFLPDLTSRFRPLRFFTRRYAEHKLRQRVRRECLHTDHTILLYHSLGMYRLIRFLHRHHRPFILEVEEIYSDVLTRKKRSARKKEDFMFAAADAFIFSTEMLHGAVNHRQRPYTVINGTYQIEPPRTDTTMFPNHDRIHCVYAGTLDPRKGGAAAAAAAAFLPSHYHIHILGFGTDAEKQAMADLVAEVDRRSEATVTYDGQLTGEAYIRFLQSCAIGLSTQDPDAAFNATSFPSKILAYMANGLRVVSIRIPAIATSAVGPYMYYYDQQTPQEIARAIQQIDCADDYDGRALLRALDADLRPALQDLLARHTPHAATP